MIENPAVDLTERRVPDKLPIFAHIVIAAHKNCASTTTLLPIEFTTSVKGFRVRLRNA